MIQTFFNSKGKDTGSPITVEQELVAVIRRLIQKNYTDIEIMDIVSCSEEMICKVRAESENA